MSQLDVVVVGAGLAGAIVASRLVEGGARCAVLEAGKRGPATLPAAWAALTRSTRSSTLVDDHEWQYRSSRPLEWMRVRATGGRTLLWGGWSLRPDARCLVAAREQGRPWPMGIRQLDSLVCAAEERLSVVSAPIGELVTRLRAVGLDAQPKRAALGPGGKRPLCAQDLLGVVPLVPDAPVLRVVLERGHVRGVEVREAAGRTAVVGATRVVLACSAVETARVLHDTSELDTAPLGTHLVDHLYCGFLAVARAPGPRRSGPLERAAFVPPRRRARGLDFSIEVRGPVSLATLDDEDLRLLDISRAAAERMSFHAVFAIGEMDPTVPRMVELDGKRRDALGRAVPRFVLPALSGDERALAGRMRSQCAEIAQLLAGAGGSVVQIRDPRDAVLGHESGTCRMGPRREGGVTDVDGRVYGVNGLYLADASRMPSALDRHPSLTLAGLALRTAERVLEDLR